MRRQGTDMHGECPRQPSPWYEEKLSREQTFCAHRLSGVSSGFVMARGLRKAQLRCARESRSSLRVQRSPPPERTDRSLGPEASVARVQMQ